MKNNKKNSLKEIPILQLMSKLREQFMVNTRLREYVERMLNVIIEHNPQLLEKTMDGDIPNVMSSTNQRKQSLTISTNEIGTKVDSSVPPTPAEPMKPTKSNDKYCRL